MKKKITFTLPAEAVREAKEGWLLGSFNNWDKEQGILMKKQKDGSLKVSVELEKGKTYQYRYFLSDGRWENDYNAQQYVHADGFHADNCLITVPEDVVKEKKQPAAKSTEKKKAVAKSKTTSTAKKEVKTAAKAPKKSAAKTVKAVKAVKVD